VLQASYHRRPSITSDPDSSLGRICYIRVSTGTWKPLSPWTYIPPYRCTVRRTQRSRLLRPLIHHQMPHSIPLLLSHLQDPPNVNITWSVFGGAGWDVEVKGQSYGNGT
jgi:hypothetical protein